jgi:hypothetical protein
MAQKNKITIADYLELLSSIFLQKINYAKESGLW